jgi:hypothetical protein
MPIRQYLNDHRFDEETVRVLGARRYHANGAQA